MKSASLQFAAAQATETTSSDSACGTGRKSPANLRDGDQCPCQLRWRAGWHGQADNTLGFLLVRIRAIRWSCPGTVPPLVVDGYLSLVGFIAIPRSAAGRRLFTLEAQRPLGKFVAADSSVGYLEN